jgi:hypothetical protein
MQVPLQTEDSANSRPFSPEGVYPRRSIHAGGGGAGPVAAEGVAADSRDGADDPGGGSSGAPGQSDFAGTFLFERADAQPVTRVHA